MATNDELSEQLAITTKLTAVVERMAKSVERMESSYESQIDTLTKLNISINNLNVDKTVQELGKISSSLKDVTDKLNNLGSVSDKSMQTMVDSFEKNTAAADSLKSELSNATKAFDEMRRSGTSSAGDVTRSVEEGAKAVVDYNRSLSGMTKNLVDKVPKAAIVGTAALTGLLQGFKNIVALSRSVIGFTTSFASGIFSIGASIVSIPLKIFTGLIDFAAQAEAGANELRQALENLRKEMGDLNKSGSQAVIQTTKTLVGFKDTGLSTWRVFGTLAERLEHVTKVAVAMGATFGHLKDEFVDNGGALLGYQKGLGVSDEQMKAVGDRAITMGRSMSKVLLTVTKQTLGLGEAFGIDQKLIGRDIAKAITDVRHFGSVTVKEIGQASVYARKLGLELEKIVGTLDAFETFDSAAENAAKLSQSFGLTVDAFQLMEAQNPAEQVEMLRKQFRSAGVDASTFSRQQLKLLESTTGLDAATAKQAFSLHNQGASLDDIKKKSEVAEKKTLTQAEAMAKLAASIERLVKTGPGQTGGFFDMFVKGILAGIQGSKEFRTIIFNIKHALNQVYLIGVQLGRLLPKLIPGLGEFLSGWGELFSPKKWTTLFGGISDVAKKYLKAGPSSMPAMMDELRGKFMDFFSGQGGSATKIMSGFKTLFKFLAATAAQGIKWISGHLAEGLGFIVDVLSGRKSLSAAGLKGPASGSLGFLQEALMPVFDALKNSWEQISPKVWDLIKLMGKKVYRFLKSEEFGDLIRPAMPYIAAFLFGPALARAALAAFSTSLLQGVFGSAGRAKLSGVFKTGFGRIIGGAGGILAAGFAAMNVGKSINDLTSKMSSEFDRSEKILGASATGIINTITLGLLPDSMQTTIAEAVAGLSKAFFGGLGSVFGDGFAGSVKDYMSSQLEVVGKIGDALSALFSGDEDAFMDAAVNLGKQLILMGSDALEHSLIQFPAMIGKWVIQIGGFIDRLFLKMIGALAEKIGGVFGGWVGDIFKNAGSALKTSAKDMKVAQDEAIDFIDGASKRSLVQHRKNREKLAKELGISDSLNKAAKDATKEDPNKKGVTDKKPKDIELNVSDVSRNLASVEQLNKKLSDKKFDLKKSLDSVKQKLQNVSFDVLTPEQAIALENGAKSTQRLEQFATSTEQSFVAMASVPKALKASMSSLKSDALRPALEAVNSMVKLANELDNALSNGDLNKVDVKAKLAKVASGVGLGGKAQYTISNKAVNITVNLQVTMNADDLEQSLIMREKSVIRDRLNFATGDGAGRRGSPQIPDKPTPQFPKINTID